MKKVYNWMARQVYSPYAGYMLGLMFYFEAILFCPRIQSWPSIALNARIVPGSMPPLQALALFLAASQAMRSVIISGIRPVMRLFTSRW